MLGITIEALSGQILIGLINGAFYALLSLGLAIIFGLLHIINFAHGVFYMLGGMVTWWLLNYLGLNYWWALFLAPLAVGAFGTVLEPLFLARLRNDDPIYGLLLTFGIGLMIQSLFTALVGSAGLPYRIPAALAGGWDLGFTFVPKYRAWIVAVSVIVCFAVWVVIEKTRLGSYLRAATEDPGMVESFGIHVPRMIAVTFGLGAAIAGLGGVLAAPIYSVSPHMGVELVTIVFAVVVIGGMGSLLGGIIAGFGLGVIEGFAKVFYPEASTAVIFVAMILVIMFRPQGLMGKY